PQRRRQCCSTSRASDPSSPPSSCRKGSSDTSTTDDKSPLMLAWRRRPGRAEVDREQGVSKSGNPRWRTTLIQLAWLWLRHQSDSTLTHWFLERVKRNGGRLRKTTIV